MKKKPEVKESEFKVVCIWCGAKIRTDKHQDSNAECLPCFYRILSEKLLAQPRAFAGDFVSER